MMDDREMDDGGNGYELEKGNKDGFTDLQLIGKMNGQIDGWTVKLDKLVVKFQAGLAQ